jgi:cytidylate kinase
VKNLIVALDGPAGSGKSTVAKTVARRNGLALVDTGAIYRCVALAATRRGIAWTDDAGLERVLPTLAISFRFQDGVNRVALDGEDVTEAIRTPDMSMGASAVSARPVVRAGLLDLQRRLALASERGAVLEGRDIGTVVFPDAQVKFFLTASNEVRARRRLLELQQKGTESTLEQVQADMEKRDRDDSSRAIAPLVAAKDAKLLDTSGLSLDDVIAIVEASVKSAG